jgi:hypothetical protein
MAYVTIPQLPAGSDLSGLEQFESVQSSTSVKLTANQIKSFISIQPSLSINDATNAGVSSAATFLHTTSGIPASGIGTAVTFAAETQLATNLNIATIGAVTTDVGSGTEDADVTVSSIAAGSIGEIARFTSTKRLGIGITTPTSPIHAVIDDAVNNAITTVGTLTHNTSGSATAGIGTGLLFQTETSAGVNKVGAAVDAIVTSTSVGSEAFDIAFSMMQGGAAVSEFVRFKSTGRVGINTSSPNAALEVVTNDANNSSVISAGRFTHTTSGTPLNGIGTAIELSTETSNSVNSIGGAIYTQATSVSLGVENFAMAFAVMRNGTAGVEVMRLTSDLRVGINTTTPAVTLQTSINDTALNTSSVAARFTHLVSGTPAIGIGTAIDFETETSTIANKVGSVISSETTSITAGVENFDLVFRTMTAGAAASEKFRIGSASITPSIAFSQFGAGVAPSATAYARLGSSSLTVAPLAFDTTSPTLLTTAPNGGFDFNGQSLYFTPQNNERGIVTSLQTYINTAGTRAGPNQINTAQTATFTGGSSTVTVTTTPGTAIGNTGCLVIFSGTTAPTGISFAQPYWVNYLSGTTMTVSATQGGTPIVPSTAGSAVTAQFFFPILGNGLNSVGLNLAAATRYQYDLYFTVSHTGAAATSVSYALTSITGTLATHGYRVTSQGSTAAISGNLTGVANTSSNFVSNYLTSAFSTPVVVTGVTAATANTTNIVQIQGQIDTLTACTYVMPVINMAVAPTLSTILQGAYMSIYPVGPVVSNTQIGNWNS